MTQPIKLFTLFLSFFLLTNLLSPFYVLALDDDQRRVINSGVLLYDTNDDASNSCANLLPGNNNEERVWNFLIGKELSPEQAAGVMGNFSVESGFDPFNQQNGSPWPSGGWGLAQWTNPGRRDAIREAVIEQLGQEFYIPTEQAAAFIGNEEEVTLLQFQLDYVFEESTSRSVRPQSTTGFTQPFDAANEWEGLKQMQTIEESVLYWEWNYERAGVPALGARLTAAQEIITRYGSGGATGSTAGNCVTNTGDFVWPTSQTATVTSCYGQRVHPITGELRLHAGADIAKGEGNSIFAAAGGTVTFSGNAGTAGLMVVIDHGNGTKTRYLHNSALIAREGDQVTAGQEISKEGNTGLSGGAHLHFEIIINDTPVNPFEQISIPQTVNNRANCS